MKTSFFKLSAIILVLALIVSACGGGGNNNNNDSQGSNNPQVGNNNDGNDQKRDPVTIKVATWNDTYGELYDMFNKKYPWITVEPVYGDTMELLVAGNAANDPIDVTWITELAPYIKDELLEDLTPFMENDPELAKAQLPEGYHDIYTINGYRWASAQVYVPTFIAVNKEMLAKHGMEMPPVDWTYDDFREMAKQATDPAAGEWGLQYDSLWALHFFSAMVAANGNAPNAVYMNEDYSQSLLATPAVMDDIRWLKSLVTQDGSLADNATGAELGLALGNEFLNGKSLFAFAGDWVFENYMANATFEWDVLPLPRGKVQQATHGMFGMLGMNKMSNHKEEAYLWIAYQFSDEAQKWKIDHGAFASVISDEIMAHYDVTPMWQGKNVEAIKHTATFTCCKDLGATVPAQNENPWGLVFEHVFNDFPLDEIIPRVENWNQRTLEVRAELGW